MSVMWKYLDKRSATIEAMKDYESMQFILRDTGEAVRDAGDRMCGVRSPSFDGMPKASGGGHGFEDRILDGIEEIDILKERYRQAAEYMAWFEPAWEELSQDEKYILEAFYRDGEGSGGAMRVMERYCIEQTSAYKRKNRALDHLTVLLFGKG